MTHMTLLFPSFLKVAYNCVLSHLVCVDGQFESAYFEYKTKTKDKESLQWDLKLLMIKFIVNLNAQMFDYETKCKIWLRIVRKRDWNSQHYILVDLQ